MLGLHRPDDGSLRVLGPRSGPRRARGPGHASGYSPEHHELPRDARAHDFVRHLAEIHGLPHQRRDITVERRALAGRASARSASGRSARCRPGRRQRVKLAQAIAHDPALVLLDEPTDGLDPVQRDDMLTLIRRVGTEFGIDIVLSSHLLEEVERVCDSAIILSGGRVVAAGTIAELTGVGRGVLVEVDGGRRSWSHALRRRAARPCSVDGDRLIVDTATATPTILYDVVPRRARGVGCGAASAHEPHGPARRRVPRGRSMSDLHGARILDRGYRSYDGPRGGQRGAVRSLVKHSVQRALGLRRPRLGQDPSRAVGLHRLRAGHRLRRHHGAFEEVLVTEPDVLPSYGDYYGFITAAIVVFTAFVAPGAAVQ